MKSDFFNETQDFTLFATRKFKIPACIDISNSHNDRPFNAGVAQLVEHHVANVIVDGSNPFTRSILCFP